MVVTNGGVAHATVTNAYIKQASLPPTVPPGPCRQRVWETRRSMIAWKVALGRIAAEALSGSGR